MPDSALARLAQVAGALGDLRERVVFIGGAIAPLLQTDPPFAGPRPTIDVDGIVLTGSYGALEELRVALRERGFREDARGPHAERWRAPGSRPVSFDLVPIGGHAGASGNRVEEAVVASAVEAEIEPGLVIRRASAPGFLALKLAAFRDRGVADPFASHDLEDVLALLASRPEIVAEIGTAPPEIRSFLASRIAILLSRGDFEDLLAGHLGNVARARAAEVLVGVRERLERIAALQG